MNLLDFYYKLGGMFPPDDEKAVLTFICQKIDEIDSKSLEIEELQAEVDKLEGENEDLRFEIYDLESELRFCTCN